MENFSTKIGKFVIEFALFMAKVIFISACFKVYAQQGNLVLFGISFSLVLFFDIRTRLGKILDKMSEKE